MDIWTQGIAPILHRRPGRPELLLKALERLEPQEREELYWCLRRFEEDLHRAEHTYRPFPGGPRIRI